MVRPLSPFPPATPELRRSGFADRACVRCGWRFFTTTGLLDHEGECDELAKVERRVLVLRERGLAVTALNNARRVQCGTCDKVSTPAGIGLHQKFSGHVGRIEVESLVSASTGSES